MRHGEIEISNNLVENAIRPFVVGQKGKLFSDTSSGAVASALIYSLLETAKVNNLRLENYVTYRLTVLPDHFAKNPYAAIDDLLPWSKQMRVQSDWVGSRDCRTVTGRQWQRPLTPLRIFALCYVFSVAQVLTGSDSFAVNALVFEEV